MPIELDLRQCRTKVLSLPDNPLRREAVVALCDRLRLPYELVDAVRCAPGDVGCALSHLRALRAAEGQLPLLVLEDDVGAAEDCSHLLTVPDDADAIWLGASIFGAMPIVNYVGFAHTTLTEEAGHGLLRAHNLLSAHAILYLSERFRQAAIDVIMRCVIDLGRAPDCGLAMIQSDFNIYVERTPRFFQAADLQPPGRAHLEEWTRLTLEPTPVGRVEGLQVDGQLRLANTVRTERGLEWAWAEDPAQPSQVASEGPTSPETASDSRDL